MNLNLKPIYLFADSQPLFDSPVNFPKIIGKEKCKAAYIGFSNDDNPAYYEIFLALMERQNISDCMHTTSAFSQGEKAFIAQADLILLSGGDVEKGWKKLKKKNRRELILNKFTEGAILIGVSAGAIQLGHGFRQDNQFTKTLGLLSPAIDVHDETNNWQNLITCVSKYTPALGGIGIPLHGGLAYHPDGAIEALQKPLFEFHLEKGSIKNNLIMPGENNA
jgi:cyanophycinase